MRITKRHRVGYCHVVLLHFLSRDHGLFDCCRVSNDFNHGLKSSEAKALDILPLINQS